MARLPGENPFEDGYAAWGTGKSWGDNPYDSECEPVNWSLWARGFDEALQDRRSFWEQNLRGDHVDGYDQDDLGESLTTKKE